MEEITQEWVTSREGAEILGTDQPNFLYYAKNGDIEWREGKRSKDRRYKVSDILIVRKKLIEKNRAKRTEPAPLVDWLLTSDLPAGFKLVQTLYSEEVDLAELAVYQSWRKHNNRVTMAAFSPDRKECLASIQVLPLAETLILDILSGKRSESSILPDEIRSYDEPGPYTLLVTNATVLPDRPELLYRVLYRYSEFWIEQYPERYITRVYAQAVSERGDLLVQHFFMVPRYDLARNAYMLDMSRPGAAKMIRRFQRALAEKAPLPAELQPDFSVPIPQEPKPKRTRKQQTPPNDPPAIPDQTLWNF